MIDGRAGRTDGVAALLRANASRSTLSKLLRAVQAQRVNEVLLVGAVVIVHLGIKKYSSEGVYLIRLDGEYLLALITECGDKSFSLIIDSQASEPKNVDPHDVVFLGKALAMNNAPNERVLH